MLKRVGLFLAVMLSLFGDANAQQDAMYTQYQFNALAINPAYAGSRNNVLNATALFRSQWIGVEGAPETQTLSFDMPVAYKRIGLGLQVINDKIGITKTTAAYGSYAYRIEMDGGNLALGLQAGIANFRADFTSSQLNTGSAPDPAFLQNINKMLPNFGAGVYFNTDRFYIGASAPHMLNNQLRADAVEVTNTFSKQYVHWFIASGYVMDVGEDYKLKPSVLVKGVSGAPMQFDINANLWIKDVLSVGASYRSFADISASVEAQISWNLHIGYAYDRSMTGLSHVNSGSHEIMLRYQFAFDRDAYYAPKCYF